MPLSSCSFCLFNYLPIGGEYAMGLVEGETIVQRKEKNTLLVQRATVGG